MIRHKLTEADSPNHRPQGPTVLHTEGSVDTVVPVLVSPWDSALGNTLWLDQMLHCEGISKNENKRTGSKRQELKVRE